MLEDGIAFGAYDSAKDSYENSFIEDYILDKIANKFHQLITKYDAIPRCRDQLRLWDKRFDQQRADATDWRRRREKYEQQVIMQRRVSPPKQPGCSDFRWTINLLRSPFQIE